MKNIALAGGLAAVSPSRIREIADVAFGMDGVLKLHFGESNLPTPPFIKAAAVRALDEGFTFYTENAGLPGLRQAIADKYGELHGLNLDPRTEIAVTASGVQALNVSIRCTLDPGDEAIVLTPNWPNASAIVGLYGGRAREVPLVWRDGRYGLDLPALEAALSARTRLLVYASPSNPLGWVARPDEQAVLLDFCRRHGLWLLADEVYERIYFAGAGGAQPPADVLPRRCGDRGAVVLQELLHDRLAVGLGGLPARPGAQGRSAERVHRLPRAVHGAARRRNGPARRRGVRAHDGPGPQVQSVVLL